MLIVDVGGGNHPLPIANIVVDMYPWDNDHRAKKEPLALYPGQKLICADIYHLPFRDKSVDFLWCTHVLEHCEDPVAACKELQRVAKSGHIATPAPVYEYWASTVDEEGWKNHLWVCYKEYDQKLQEEALRFWRKPKSDDWKWLPQSSCETVLGWTNEFLVTELSAEYFETLMEAAQEESS